MVSPGEQSGDDRDNAWVYTDIDTKEQSRPVTTWQGWQDFATAPPPVPPGPDTAPRGREERLAYHSTFVTVRTPAIDTLATNVRTLMILGRHQHTTARPSLIVTGPAAAGKTTALLHVGRACHLAEAARRGAGGAGVEGRVPVAYVLVPPGATAKALAAEFARYLGVPVTTRMTQAQITEAVCHTYDRVGVRLVLIDEIHRLNPRTTTGAETADLLKDLTERIRATFVYAGIDVAATALFAGVRGAQLAGRACLVECGAFPARLGTREPFKELIAGVETALDPKRTPGRDTTAASRRISTTAPPDGSAASPASSAKPPSPRSTTAPNASPGPLWTLCASTTSPKHTNVPAPPPGHAHPGDRHTPEPCSHAKPCDLHKHGPGL
ncbi:TniB family NTP-binding protein [Embleya sp. NPDC005971]|uniref:TniB family NTP-binding protein n=1 Tax=Embleya sp. NPDC005971 TaxID=3156724 RepID=UPI0033E78C9E